MLASIDKALAGAIDFVADGSQATVKSVREQGVQKAFTGAVGDAAGKVVGNAGDVFAGFVGGKKEEQGKSSHSGVASGYADLCASTYSRQSGAPAGVPNRFASGALFPYEPPPARCQVSGGAAPHATPVVSLSRSHILPYVKGGAQPYTPGPTPGRSAAQRPGAEPGRHTTALPRPDQSVPDADAAARFEELCQRDPASRCCMDCGAARPEWASISFAVLLCIECSGHHRRMGTHISRVRSCRMDAWTEPQLGVFEYGGNARMAEFFAANGLSSAGPQQRYQTPAAEWYREAFIRCKVAGSVVPAPPAGVLAGPCGVVAEAVQPACCTPAAAEADLLNFDICEVPREAGPPHSSANADLLDFGTGAPRSPGAPGGQDNPMINPVGFDLLDIEAPARGAPVIEQLVDITVCSSVSCPDQVCPVSSASLATATSSGTVSGTLAGGARLAVLPQEKANDLFAMALQKWGSNTN